MRSLPIIALVALLLAACTTPEEAAVEQGGKAPVLCLDNDNFSFCIDAAGVEFVCLSRTPSRCVSVTAVRRVLSGNRAEAAQ